VEDRGIVLIVGCGHPTVEKIVARAEALFDQPVVGIVGGLHYEGFSFEDVQSHIEFLSTHNLHLVPYLHTIAALNHLRYSSLLMRIVITLFACANLTIR